MENERPPARHSWAPQFVLVVIPDETAQAMVCVALEQTGFQPVAVGAHEAPTVAAGLPRSPVAMVTMPSTQWEQHGRRRGPTHRVPRPPALPVIMIDPPPVTAGRRSRRVLPPDLAGIVRAVEALAVV